MIYPTYITVNVFQLPLISFHFTSNKGHFFNLLKLFTILVHDQDKILYNGGLKES